MVLANIQEEGNWSSPAEPAGDFGGEGLSSEMIAGLAGRSVLVTAAVPPGSGGLSLVSAIILQIKMLSFNIGLPFEFL